tara:strand:- start:5438 stop:5845 length:408 start_codon:yes stop_codon:yes gene_type:complete
MDKKTAIGIRKILEQELTPILKKAGYIFELGNATFNEDQVHFKGFKISDVGAKPEMLKFLEKENEHRKDFGMPLLSLDRIASYRGKKYQLVGLRPRSKKQPFIVRDIDSNSKYIWDKRTTENFFEISKELQNAKT